MAGDHPRRNHQAAWQRAYLEQTGPILSRRFVDEARASLPGLASAEATFQTSEVSAALHVQRLRLPYDQQIPEWTR